MFLKEKKNCDIKGRACVNRRKYQETIKKEDVSSHKVTTESVFITHTVDAPEGRDMAKFDTPGAYLHTETDEDVIMFLE